MYTVYQLYIQALIIHMYVHVHIYMYVDIIHVCVPWSCPHSEDLKWENLLKISAEQMMWAESPADLQPAGEREREGGRERENKERDKDRKRKGGRKGRKKRITLKNTSFLTTHKYEYV